MENWELEHTVETVETTALQDHSVQREGLHGDWRVTARKFTSALYRKVAGYAGLEGQLTAGAQGYYFTPLMVTCEHPDGSGTTIFECNMLMTRARWTNPQGAVAEDIEFVAAETPIKVPTLM